MVSCVIKCSGYSFPCLAIVRYAKFGLLIGDLEEKPRVQTITLDCLRFCGEKHKMSLGEIKTAIYMASRDGEPSSFPHSDASVQAFRDLWQDCRLLLKGPDLNGRGVDWGGDLSQFVPVLEKIMYHMFLRRGKWNVVVLTEFTSKRISGFNVSGRRDDEQILSANRCPY
jgi:hypothetical protein